MNVVATGSDRSCTRVFSMVARVMILLTLVGRSAAAHAILMASLPAPQGRVPPGNLAISLQFNSLIDVKRSRLTLIEPGKEQLRLPITASGQGDRMVAIANVSPGPTILRWQVLALDGHITRGDIDFSVDEAAADGTRAKPAP